MIRILHIIYCKCKSFSSIDIELMKGLLGLGCSLSCDRYRLVSAIGGLIGVKTKFAGSEFEHMFYIRPIGQNTGRVL